jgi:hypothetical protein
MSAQRRFNKLYINQHEKNVWTRTLNMSTQRGYQQLFPLSWRPPHVKYGGSLWHVPTPELVPWMNVIGWLRDTLDDRVGMDDPDTPRGNT